jgi:4-hydroxybenzoate polyprenyltransferase
MYVGLTAATILLIRNWFKIVTSTDREKQVGVFKKNLLYIVIWVVLLIWFYYIIDIFVSVVNLVTD